uniref:Uncharacterized protein n=1 Tax=Eutreptiella gymnastica TaxID=73025 RepID=A0A7S1IXW3_9EUGL
MAQSVQYLRHHRVQEGTGKQASSRSGALAMLAAAGEDGDPTEELRTSRTYALEDGRILQITYPNGRLRARPKKDSWGITTGTEGTREWFTTPTGELVSKDGRRMLVDALGHVRAVEDELKSLTPVECTRDPSGLLKLSDGKEIVLDHSDYTIRDTNDCSVFFEDRDADLVVPVPDKELPSPTVWGFGSAAEAEAAAARGEWDYDGKVFTTKEAQQLYINDKGFAGIGKQGQYTNTDPSRREFAVHEDGAVSFSSESPFSVLTVDADGFVVGVAEAQVRCLYNAETQQLVMSDGRQVFVDSDGWVKAKEGAVMAEPAGNDTVRQLNDTAGQLTSADGRALYVSEKGFVGATASDAASTFSNIMSGHDNEDPKRSEWAVDDGGVLSLVADGRQVYIDSYGRACAGKPDCGGLAPCTLDGSGVIVEPDGRKLRLDENGWAYAVPEGASPLVADNYATNLGRLWTYDETGALTSLGGHKLFMSPDGRVCAGKDKWYSKDELWSSHSSWSLDSSGRVTLQGQSFAVKTSRLGDEEVWLDVLKGVSKPKWSYDKATGAITTPDGLHLVIDDKYGHAYAVPAAEATDIDPKLRTWKVDEENRNYTTDEIVDGLLKGVLGFTDEEIKEMDETLEARKQLWLLEQKMKEEMNEDER